LYNIYSTVIGTTDPDFDVDLQETRKKMRNKVSRS